MTTDSAEAVLPRTPITPARPASVDERQPTRANPRASVPVSLSDFDMYPEIPEDDDIGSLCGMYILVCSGGRH